MIYQSCKTKIKEIENKLNEMDGSNIKSKKTNKKSQLEKKLKELTDKKQMVLNYVCAQSGSTERFLFPKAICNTPE